MADRANSTPASEIHDLPPGYPPGGASFTPLVEREFVMAYPPTHLMRSSEQRLLDLNRRYDRVLKFYDAAWDAYDGEQDSAKREKADNASGHAVRMLREIQAEAYIIPARSLQAVALKARIMSEAKKTWWDPSDSHEDADARVLIEDVLALAGMDRIHSRSFEFSDLLPGYDGPKLFEGTASPMALRPSSIPPAAPARSSSFWTETADDADYRCETHPESALIAFAGSVAALQEREHAAWDKDLEQPGPDAAARVLSDALKEAMHHLAMQPARTPEGLCAKAGVLVAIDDWGQDGFGELALSVAKDAVWIGTQSRFQISHLEDMLKDGSVAAQVAA